MKAPYTPLEMDPQQHPAPKLPGDDKLNQAHNLVTIDAIDELIKAVEALAAATGSLGRRQIAEHHCAEARTLLADK